MTGTFDGRREMFESKHVGIRYHYLQQKIEEGEIILKYVMTDDHIADILTKPLLVGKFPSMKEHLVTDE